MTTESTAASDKLKALVAEAEQLLPDFLRDAAGVKSTAQIEELRLRYLGKKGRISALMKSFGALSPEERPLAGKAINEQKDRILAELEHRAEDFGKAEAIERMMKESLDVTLPGTAPRRGRLHPLTQVRGRIESIFTSMGFEVVETMEIEDDWHNFEALNLPPDHPARDMQDTFYVDGGRLLRTHTSPAQIRTMLKRNPPLAIICPGKVYRCDSDITHSPMFHQVEGLMIDKGIGFGHLKGVLTEFVQALFGAGIPTRFRPSFFPFTEPSAEVDMGCPFCGQKGCRICGQSGWIEILGSGMVHPQVLKNVGFDPAIWSGFAFGMGIERITMIKYGIDDIRLFYEGDQRFLAQF